MQWRPRSSASFAYRVNRPHPLPESATFNAHGVLLFLLFAAAAFLGLVGGVSALFGFSRTLATAKKADTKVLQQAGTRQGIILMDEGATLALRALGWGTLYAVLGTGAFCYGFWKLSGAKDVRTYLAHWQMDNVYLPPLPSLLFSSRNSA